MAYPKLPDTKRLQVKSGSTQTFFIYYGDNSITIPAAPTGVTFTDNTPSADWLRIQVNGSTASDSTSNFVAFSLVIDVVALASSVVEIPTCCDENSLSICWLNQIGGWQSWTFRRVRTFSLEVGDKSAQTFISGLTKKYASIGDVYEGESVSFEVTSKAQIDTLATLKYSIQAFVYNSDTEEFDIPVLINRESFSKYSNALRDKVFTFSFKFIYAEKLSIQTQ
jgi:hypothetical protein